MPQANKTKFKLFLHSILCVTWLFNFFHIEFYKNKYIGLTVKKTYTCIFY